MQIHLGVGALGAEWDRAVVCIGTFDGVHLGHAAVIRTAVEEAARQEVPAILVTFDRHPAAVLAPDRNPPILAPLEVNLREFERLGVAATVVLPFDEAFSQISAERFLSEMIVGALRADSLVVGHDFAMGHGREGTTEWLAARIPTTIVPPFAIEGERVSSSAIRGAVARGDVRWAAARLGRPYGLAGVVVGGQRLGRQLGFPTANLARSIDQLLPADGVYAGWFEFSRGRYAAAASIGTRPAVGGLARTIEAYLLAYDGPEFYGAAARLDLVERLRDERDFPSLSALTEQIERDVATVRTFLETFPSPPIERGQPV